MNTTAAQPSKERAKPEAMRFVLKDFKQSEEYRIFAFEGRRGMGERTGYSVRIDLAMSRRYGIRMQELPLLCLSLLERAPENESNRALTYTEADMHDYSARIAGLERSARNKRVLPPRNNTPAVQRVEEQPSESQAQRAHPWTTGR